MQPSRYKIPDANLEVRPDLGCLRRPDGEEIYLRPKTFQTLLLLLQNRHKIVTKDDIVREVWPETAVTDDAVVQCIVEIGKVLGDDAKQARFIRTFPKSGYRFVGDVDVEETVATDAGLAGSAGALSAAKVPEVGAADGTAPRSSRPAKQSMFVPATILMVSLALIATSVALSLRLEPVDPGVGVLETIAREGEHRNTIAVMFLQNQSQTPELEWLSEGLADMLVTGLSRSKALSVIGRQQLEVLLDRVGHARGTAVDLKQALEVARRARLDHFVLGTFAKLGTTIRVDLRLHDAAGRLVKTEALTIDTPDELLKQVDLLGWRLAQHFGELPAALPSATTAMTTNLEAYRAYSVGVSKANAFSNDDAVQLFTRATELDPEFAMAFGRIGYVYGVLGTQVERARPFLTKAYSLTHRLSEKERLQVEAWNAIVHFDYAAAATSLAQLIRAYPAEVESYSRLGVILAGERRYEEAVDVLNRGLAVDPESGDLWNRLGGVLDEMRRSPDAIAARQKYVALHPREANSYDSLGYSFQAAGRYDEAVAAYDRALTLNPTFEIALIHLGHTRFQMGQYKAAEATYRRYLKVVSFHRDMERGSTSLAVVAHRRGRFREAISLARQARGDQPPSITEALIRVDAGEPADRIAQELQAPVSTPNRGSRSGTRAWNHLQGVFALKRGAPAEALEHFRAALRDRPLFADANPLEDGLANAFLQLGRYDEAIAEYERVLRINPRYPLAHYRLGQAFEGKRQPDLARKAYTEFLRVWADADPDAPEIIDARKRLVR